MKKQNTCWYTAITKRTVREHPEKFTNAHIGRYLIRECVDLFDDGEIVTSRDIERQFQCWRAQINGTYDGVRGLFEDEASYVTYLEAMLIARPYLAPFYPEITVKAGLAGGKMLTKPCPNMPKTDQILVNI